MAAMPVMTPACPQVAQATGPLASYLRDQHDAELDTEQKPRRTLRRARECGRAQRRTRQSGRRQTNRTSQPTPERREPKRRSGRQHSDVPSHDPKADATYVVCVRCGRPITYPNERRCEDCFADDVNRWPGTDQSATLNM
jgi:hypothetical protein